MSAVPSAAGGTPVLILKEGTQRTRGREAQALQHHGSEGDSGDYEVLAGAAWDG